VSKADGTHGVHNSRGIPSLKIVSKPQTNARAHTVFAITRISEPAENHRPEFIGGAEQDIIIKNNSFQWIQTIVRSAAQTSNNRFPHIW
jgi:hypothetical protein